ncbi:MAG: hypothetical protein J6T10_29275 [Methanobrevibacter sp.]|nr:hypothetical protein [Methanobrevibacter sp.]
MDEVNRKQIGRIGLSMAINYFTLQGYTVSLPMNDTQWYDIVIEKDGKFETVQCKATQTKDNRIDFRSTGGTKGEVYDNLLNHSELDYLFCVNKDLDMWLIPIKEITTTRQITLRTEPNKNNQGFQTYKYRVRFSDKA